MGLNGASWCEACSHQPIHMTLLDCQHLSRFSVCEISLARISKQQMPKGNHAGIRRAEKRSLAVPECLQVSIERTLKQ